MADIKSAPQSSPLTVPAGETYEEKKARIATVRSRNLGLSHLDVPNPDPNLHYEWVHDDHISRLKKQNLGFSVVKDPVTMNYTDAKGENIAGDVVLMAIPKDDYAIIKQLDHEDYVRRHGKVNADGTTTVQGEEKEFDGRASQSGLSIIDESASRTVGKNEIQSALGEG